MLEERIDAVRVMARPGGVLTAGQSGTANINGRRLSRACPTFSLSFSFSFSALIFPAVPDCPIARPLRLQLPQHELQDPAVPEVLGFLRCVDAYCELEVARFAVSATHLCVHPFALRTSVGDGGIEAAQVVDF